MNGRKGLACSAAVIVVFVLLAGVANALAITGPKPRPRNSTHKAKVVANTTGTNTVWCVPNVNVYPSCTNATTFTHIEDAVEAASDGDVVMVGPGRYNESVDVETCNLSIFGAQAGRDARTRDGFSETIVDASGKPYTGKGTAYGAVFYNNCSNDVIDGFTIQGGTSGAAAAGIYSYEGYTVQFTDNIIQNNAIGIYLYESEEGILVQHNLIRKNNQGTVGSDELKDFQFAGPGVGVVVDESGNGLVITDNAFQGNHAAAVFLEDCWEGVQVTHNTSNGDGALAVLYSAAVGIEVSNNQGWNFAAHALPLTGTTYANAAIEVGYYGYGVSINDNVLGGGAAPNYSGIDFTAALGADYTYDPYEDVYFYDPVCYYCQVSNNRITGFTGYGIVAELMTATGSPVYQYGQPATLQYSAITNNQIQGNGAGGILIQDAAGNGANSLVNNDLWDNRPFDCEDETLGSSTMIFGTAGTANTWFKDAGESSSPNGLCGKRRY